MKRTKWGWVVVGMLAGCSFPEVLFTETSSSSGSGGAGQGGGSTTSTTTATTTTTTSTATTSTTSGGVCGGGACSEGPCGRAEDKDCDGHADANCGGGGNGGAGGALPYDDCDDCDPNVFKGQMQFFSTERDAGGYDYSCDGVQEHQFESVQCGGLGCGQMNMFVIGVPVECGVTKSFGNCKLKGLIPTCQADQVQDKPQGCR